MRVGVWAYLCAAGMIAPAVFLFISGRRRRQKNQRKIYLLVPLVTAAGAFLYQRAVEPDRLLVRYEAEAYAAKSVAGVSGITSKGPEVTAEGCAARFEEKKNGYWIYLDDARVTWEKECYGKQGIVWSCKELPDIRLGNRILITGELEQFSGISNPGEFDSRAYYRANGYGYLMETDNWKKTGNGENLIRQWLWELRVKMSERIAACAESGDAGVLQAVFLGDSSGVEEETRLLYQDQGIAHLLSVSGLHVTLFAMTFYRICRRITGSYGFAGFLGGIFAVCYGVLTGGTVSATRAVIMYLISATAAWRGRIYDTPTALAAAAVLTVISRPLAVSQSPFLLSYTAVLGVSVLGEIWQGFLGPFEKDRRFPMLGLQAGTLPVILYFYYQYPLYSMIVNSLALPVSSVLLVGAAGCGLFGNFPIPGFVFGQLGHWILQYYEFLCGLFAKLPGSRQVNGRPAFWRLAVYGFLWAILCFSSWHVHRKRKKTADYEVMPNNKRLCGMSVHRTAIHTAAVRTAAVLFLAASCLFLRADRGPGLSVTMLDVGQGDCFLAEISKGKSFLCDAGSTGKSGLARYTLEPVLLSKGIGKLDFILLSHADEDHINGVRELLERNRIAVGFIGIPDYQEASADFSDILAAAEADGYPVLRIASGDRIEMGEVSLEFLHPEPNESISEKNASSLVFRLCCGDFSMLFTGDLPEKEEMMCQPVDVLKIAHHGSDTSTSAEWLAQLDPAAVLISCGRGNRYGHPSEKVLERIRAQGADCYITARQGPVRVTSDGTGFQIFAKSLKNGAFLWYNNDIGVKRSS